jgi:hypothetical protein
MALRGVLMTKISLPASIVVWATERHRPAGCCCRSDEIEFPLEFTHAFNYQ